MTDEERKQEYARAIKAYRKSNESRWSFAFWSSRIVGKYGRGGTLGLANDANVSTDTVEDHAHAYWLYERLQHVDEGAGRNFVRLARKLPYIYISHFRALYDLQISYHLTDTQVVNFLLDIVQAEGELSSRKLEEHIRSKLGDTRTWEFYAAKALKALNQTEGQPDLPNVPEAIGNIYSVAFDVDGDPVSFLVVAFNESRAENMARKQLAKDRGEELEKASRCISNRLVGEALTDSKNILNMTSSWLGDNA